MSQIYLKNPYENRNKNKIKNKSDETMMCVYGDMPDRIFIGDIPNTINFSEKDFANMLAHEELHNTLALLDEHDASHKLDNITASLFYTEDSGVLNPNMINKLIFNKKLKTKIFFCNYRGFTKKQFNKLMCEKKRIGLIEELDKYFMMSGWCI